jgi:hypothetical protein
MNPFNKNKPVFGKNKTHTELIEDQYIRRHLKAKEASREKHLSPYEDDDNDEPYLEEDKVYDEFWEDFSKNGDDSEDLEDMQLKKMEQHLEKYANPFPIDVFPEPIKRHILDLAESLNFPQEFYAASILSTTAGAIRNNFHLLFKEGVPSIAVLYLLIVGKAGLNKSTPLARALQPLSNKEFEYDLQHKQQLASYRKNKNDGNRDAESSITQRCLINDATMEATLDILSTNQLGLTLYNDEYMGFLNSMNKYRSGDDVQKWLSIWSNKPMRIDRKKQESVLISMPFVNSVGTIQTDVLIKFIHSFKDNNGFIDRLLYATASAEVYNSWNDKKPNIKLEEEYHKLIKKITDVKTCYDNNGNVSPKMFRMSTDAFAKIVDWQNENTRICSSTSNPQIVGIYKKLEVYALRFTLIMAVLDYAHKCPTILDNERKKLIATVKHVDAAIKITEYFRNSAKSIIRLVSQKITTVHYNDSFTQFFDALPARFTTRDAILVGNKNGLSERTIFNYLKFDLIIPVGRGKYQKRYRRI